MVVEYTPESTFVAFFISQQLQYSHVNIGILETEEHSTKYLIHMLTSQPDNKHNVFPKP